MNENDLKHELENEDVSEFYDENNFNKQENSAERILSLKEKMDKIWDNFLISILSFYRKISNKKTKLKDLESSERKKHDKLFNLVFKYFGILLLFAFLLILFVAFLKVFVFSRDIVHHEKRPDVNKHVDDINFGIGKDYSWQNKINFDVKQNSKNIKSIEEAIKINAKNESDNIKDLKKIIIDNSVKNKEFINKKLINMKKDFYSYVDDSISSSNDMINKQMKNILYEKRSSHAKEYMHVPEHLSVINTKKETYVDGYEEENSTVPTEKKEEVKKAIEIKKHEKEKKKLLEKDEKIYMSINIENVDSDGSGYDSSDTNKKDINNTLPPIVLRQGMTNGVLVTGVSAPTFEMDKNPAVVLMTFKGESIISNMFEQDVENCTATGSVFGNIITRRAEILVNKISCTFEENGKQYMVRANVKGWVFDGNDGRFGLPGIVVDSSGSILNDSMIIGALQGFGKFVSSTAQIYGQQGTAMLNTGGSPLYSPAQVAKTSLVGGMGEQLSGGFNTITEYYKKIIDTLYPYIDVKGGRKITVFFDGGEKITPVEYRPFLVNEHDTSDNDDDNMNVEVNVDEW